VVIDFSGDADIDAGAKKARRYMTALIDMIRAAEDLDGNVELSWGGGQDFDAEHDGDRTRHAVALGVMVRIHEPT
jgi:hypothetical protein